MLYAVDGIWGVIVDNVVYGAGAKSSVIKTYSADSLVPLGEDIHVDGMRCNWDIVACRHDGQLFIADDGCVWHVSVDDRSYVKWLSTDDAFHIFRLSVTSGHLLVTSHPPSLRQYSLADGRLLRVVCMPDCVKELYQGVETTRGTFMICHQGTSHDPKQTAVSRLLPYE